ncbi:SNF2 family amino-terminal protein [Rhizoctonia solani]|uniref:SNF2 family amino-terminal protein n=1 Tax=Rhizoctonia solani TaxID=456999 RepID=A0A8H8T161_9AGAM|nr:SNF2 family amino-terminal protein [Rhizoctonia solani]QRW25469.1 SNF2 family amino-terminal protein [Rhizoctonia solani]
MAAPVDPSHYVIEYAKNSSEKCHGRPPCHGSTIVLGDLRFGTKKYNGVINDKMQYRHWGCVTPDILYDLAILGVNRLPGLARINISDQAKIHTAAQRLRIDDADVPVTARSLTRTTSVPSGSQRRASERHLRSANERPRRHRKSWRPSRGKTQAGSAAPLPVVLPPPPPPTAPAAMYTQPPRPAPALPVPPAHMGTQITVSQQKRDDEDYAEDDYGAEEEAQYTDFYLSFQSSVVGVQYYDGLGSRAWEQVALVREPTNKYDRNAIQVMNIGMRQVGHIPRQVAANLAPLIDRELVLVEGTMNDGNIQGTQYTLNVTLSIYGKPGLWRFPRSIICTKSNLRSGSSSQPQLSQKAMEALEIRRRAEELRTMLAGLEKVDDEGRRANFLDALYGNQTEDILNLPEHPSPPGKEDGTLVVDLLKHQKQGLLWCINRENVVLPTKHGEPHQQFWEYRAPPGSRAHYMNLITKSPIPASMPPPIGHGGIMSDSMGLGKSLTFLALVIATKNTRPEGFDKPTLIVCPLSVLSNWETQIDDHCNPGILACYTYYGNNRNVDPEVLKGYDVVLTTYQTVSSDFERAGGFKNTEELMAENSEEKRRSKGLFSIQWKRVVLDEAHQIRNPSTKIAQAATAIDGYYRWAVSGTPIVNSPTDLGSLLAFLRMCSPLDQISQFNRSLARPLQKGNPESMALLREIMKHISIRRSKEREETSELPQVMIHVTKVDLDDAARRIYNSVEALSRQRFMEMANASQDGERVPNVVLVSRLTAGTRQIALHPGLVPSDYLQQLQSGEKYGGNDPPTNNIISPQEKARLQNILFRAEEDSEECAICFDNLKNPRILPDGHYFCYECIAGYIEAHGALATCPMDRRPITLQDLIEPPPPTDLTQVPIENNTKGLSDGSSVKIDQLIWLLKRIPSEEKAVVFSQFTSFLDKIADQLEVHGISYVEFNGGLSAKRRQEVLQRFSRPLPVKNSAIRRTSNGRNTKDSGSDSDYAPGDDDFIDDDDGTYFSATQSSKGKGKVGKGKGKTTSGRAFGGNPKVLLISLKSGATGLNLTVANHLFLMDPWWQEAIESQAIDRVNRIGQKRDVHVYQMITNDTAFSGMGGREAVREKRETRMQGLSLFHGTKKADDLVESTTDFIELFGLQRQNGRVTLGEDAAAAQVAAEEEEPDWLPTGPIKRSRLMLSDDE